MMSQISCLEDGKCFLYVTCWPEISAGVPETQIEEGYNDSYSQAVLRLRGKRLNSVYGKL